MEAVGLLSGVVAALHFVVQQGQEPVYASDSLHSLS